jgi:histidine decarboxylase
LFYLGIKGLEKDVLYCFDNAKYLHQKLLKAGIQAERNELSTTVVLERPNEDFVQRWQLACEGDIAHVVVMPNITPAVIDTFVDELVSGC